MVPWQVLEVVVLLVGGLVVVVVLLVVVVVVFVVVVVVVVLGGEVVVVVVGGAVVVVGGVEGGAGLFGFIVLNLAWAWSWYQEADAGPGERMGVTKSVAVTTAAEVPAKSAIVLLPRIFSNDIAPVPPRSAAPPAAQATCGVSVREGTQRIQVLLDQSASIWVLWTTQLWTRCARNGARTRIAALPPSALWLALVLALASPPGSEGGEHLFDRAHLEAGAGLDGEPRDDAVVEDGGEAL